MATGTRVRPERKGYDKVCFQQHVERVHSMKSTIDCGPPRPHPLSNKREMDKVCDFIYFETRNYRMFD